MKEHRRDCVLYVTATCNLKCIYCYIDKSPILMQIDKMLEDSYKGDYYFDFMKEMFYQDNLQKIEFWGGEPTYGLCRAFPTLHKAIQYFPNLHEFYFSTNLTTETCVSDIINFLSLLGQYPERRFQVGLQLSLDGPQYINDFNRGVGTTEKFTKNFSKLICDLRPFLEQHANIQINANFKPTLDIKAIAQLQTEQSIIEYYQFLDRFVAIANSNLAQLGPHRWHFHPAIPNVATPSPITTEDGKYFANLCACINKIHQGLGEQAYFTEYSAIMPFMRFANDNYCGLDCGCGTCGTGDIILGLLPNRMISTCHNGFVELIQDYKQHAPDLEDYQIEKTLFTYNKDENAMICTQEEYGLYERQIQRAFCREAVFQTTEMAAVIREMARLGQVDKKYLDPKEAVLGAHFIQHVTSSCIRDNVGVSGSRYLFQMGNYRLFLNGAKEEIQRYAKDF